MDCPKCHARMTAVETRQYGVDTRRVRRCPECHTRAVTWERIERILLPTKKYPALG